MSENFMVGDVDTEQTEWVAKGKVRGDGVDAPYNWVGRAISQMYPTGLDVKQRIPTSDGKSISVEDILAATGSSEGSYTHAQSEPSDTWTVVHNLGRFVGVTILLASG